MVLINKAINEITVKLVYYGPGLCGKTTNLEKIYQNPKLDHKGKMISMATETDRTLFFDFMPMELGMIGGNKVRVQLYTVPGQVFYDATRKLVLRGTDGVVFVADSQESMRQSNLESLENLKTNLKVNRLDPDKVALVFQYNKRDLPNVSSVEELNSYLNPGGAPTIEASAINGQGVTATLRAAVSRILDNLKNGVNVTLADAPELAAPDMSARSGVTSMSAGTPKLTMKAEPDTATTKPIPAMPAAAAQPPGRSRPPASTAPNFTNKAPAAAESEPDPFGEIDFSAIDAVDASSQAEEAHPAVAAEPVDESPEPFEDTAGPAVSSAVTDEGPSIFDDQEVQTSHVEEKIAPVLVVPPAADVDLDALLLATRQSMAAVERALEELRRQEQLLLDQQVRRRG